MSSKMPQVYIHYFGNESSKSLLEAYGIEDNSKNEKANILKPKACPNCEETNKPESKFCFKCKMVLTFDSYKETLELQIEKDKGIQILKSKADSLNKQVENIPLEIGKQFSDLFQKYGLVDYNLSKKETK